MLSHARLVSLHIARQAPRPRQPALAEGPPFGGTRSTSGAFGTDRAFTGQRLDSTGLYFYNARYYDATIGRFISPDTIVQAPYDPQSLNRYSYVMNNPLRYVDPTGNCWGKFRNAAPCMLGRMLYHDMRQNLVVPMVQGTAELVVGAGQAILDAPYAAFEGAQWVVGVDEVVHVTVQIGEQEVTYSNFVAKESGINLINRTLHFLDAGAVAIGGPIGVLSRDPLDVIGGLHEGQHIMEQEYFGAFEWHVAYQTEIVLGVMGYGDLKSAYKYHSAENRARLAAGEPTFDWYVPPLGGGHDDD